MIFGAERGLEKPFGDFAVGKTLLLGALARGDRRDFTGRGRGPGSAVEREAGEHDCKRRHDMAGSAGCAHGVDAAATGVDLQCAMRHTCSRSMQVMVKTHALARSAARSLSTQLGLTRVGVQICRSRIYPTSTGEGWGEGVRPIGESKTLTRIASAMQSGLSLWERGRKTSLAPPRWRRRRRGCRGR